MVVNPPGDMATNLGGVSFRASIFNINDPSINTYDLRISYTLYYDNYHPCIDWDAQDYWTWKADWSDITINGLFPEMTPASFFADLLDIDEQDDTNPANGIIDWWEGQECVLPNLE